MRSDIKKRISMIINNKVPEGYKKQRNECYPIDWNLLSYNKLFKVASGSGLTQKDMTEGNIPVYGGNGISGYHSEFNSEDENIIIGRVGAYCGSINLFEGKCWITDNALYIKEKYMDYDNKFLFYNLQYKNLNRFADKNAQPLISGSKIYEIKTAIPPKKSEQKGIANVLSTWDKAIELNDKLLEAKKEQKRGLMKALLFEKKRLKGFSDKWQEVYIKDVANQVSRINKENNDYTVLSCTKYSGLVESLKYFCKQVFSEDTSKYKIVGRDEFVYATNHIEEGSIGVQNLMEYGLVSPMYTVFKVNDKVDKDYLFYVLKTEEYISIYKSMMSASVDRRGSLRWNEFSKIKINLPSVGEQKSIARVFLTADKEISLLEKELEALKEQKKGLMQLLLTGIVRVNS